MRSLHDWIYDVEAGPFRAWLVRLAIFLLVTGLAVWIGIREFNGLRTFEAMDLAQQAAQIAEGRGFKTLLIRPLALWQVRSNLGEQAPSVGSFPETLTPPLYPVLLASLFKAGTAAKMFSFEMSAEALKGFRIYPPDYLVLILQLSLVVLTVLAVYQWAQRQFDVGTGVLAVTFFLGSSSVWSSAVAGGTSLLIVFLYALAGWLLCLGTTAQDSSPEDESGAGGWIWFFLAGLTLGAAALVQFVQIWPVLASLGLAWVVLRRGKMAVSLGVLLMVAAFCGWLARLWMVSRNPVGLNWAYLLADSANFPGEMVWRTYNFDMEKTDIWRRLGGSILRGFSDLISAGPALCGNAIAGSLALIGVFHAYRRPSAAAGRFFWGGLFGVLVVATAFIQRSKQTDLHPILLVMLPFACVYGSAYLWILIERWKIHLELVGRLFAILVALLASWPTLARLVLPEPSPFAYPPTYPPIFVFMRSWFEPGELQAGDLPAAEAWYAQQPTLWLPTTREDFLKIHDRVSPVFSILLTPASSDSRMYSQMLVDNSEWKEWADLIRRQKPPDLPQAFATSLPPNNDYLLLSIQKRWN